MNDIVMVVGWLCGWWLLARIPRLPHRPPAVDRRLSIVIPARDEAHNLPELLASLPPGHDIVVVDDESSDETASVAAAAGARVVPAGTRPDGWYGKPWACSVGAATALGEHLVFVDADVRFEPGGFDRLVAALDGRGGLVSVQPWHQLRRQGERLVAVCNIVSMMGTGAFTPLPRRRKVRTAFGPCLAISASDYRAVGGHGHANVRAAVAEDVALARVVRASGRSVSVYGGDGAVRFRMYDGARSVIRGYSKNLMAGARSTRLVTFSGVFLWLAAAALTATGRGGVLGYGAFVTQISWMIARLGNFGVWPALAYPLPLAVFFLAFTRSALARVTGRGVEWRGRRVR